MVKGKHFSMIWISQTAAVLGNVLMAFSLGIWAYQQTGSITQFGLVVLLGYVPELLVLPVAGVITDRLPRKWILIACSSLQALMYGLVLVNIETLTISQACIIIAFASVAGGFHRAAYNASLALLSGSPKGYARLNGMFHFSLAASHLVAPILAGVLIQNHGISSVVVVAISVFAIAAAILTFVSFPELSVQKEPRPFLKDLLVGFQYIHQRSELIAFLGVHAFSNFARGSAVVLFTPFILSFSTADVLGVLRSTAGAGMVLGAALISAWGGPENRLRGVFVSLLLTGLLMSILGSSTNVYIIALAVLGLFVLTPVLASLAHSIWQHKIPVELHGRVFSARDTVAGTAFAAAYLITPIATDGLIKPIVADNPASSMYLAMGAVTIIIAAAAPKLRHLQPLKTV